MKLSAGEIARTADWIAAQQEPDGELPWWRSGKSDPWDHVHSAMGLVVAGRLREARRAWAFLEATQQPSGGWVAEREAGVVRNRTIETNHAAYVATGLWLDFLVTRDRAVLERFWPMLEGAIDFVVSMQEPDGTVSWALSEEGEPWRAPLLTGSSSTYGSLVSAARIADALDRPRLAWSAAHDALGAALRDRSEVFERANVVEAIGRHSMDWYYPILGGALRGGVARERLLDEEPIETYMAEGVGCRCVRDEPWYTVAETCELAVTLDVAGLPRRAREVFGWMRAFRVDADGAYETGKTHPEGVFWPEERNAWTAAAVILADDALFGKTRGARLFHDLGTADDAIAEAAAS